MEKKMYYSLKLFFSEVLVYSWNNIVKCILILFNLQEKLLQIIDKLPLVDRKYQDLSRGIRKRQTASFATLFQDLVHAQVNDCTNSDLRYYHSIFSSFELTGVSSSNELFWSLTLHSLFVHPSIPLFANFSNFHLSLQDYLPNFNQALM